MCGTITYSLNFTEYHGMVANSLLEAVQCSANSPLIVRMILFTCAPHMHTHILALVSVSFTFVVCVTASTVIRPPDM